MVSITRSAAMRVLHGAMLGCAMAALLSACSRDPLQTALPLNLADIPKIQPQLDKLKPEESELVLAYLKRSNGDVLPAKFADPDEPFTARTFVQAIKLQRDFAAKQAVANAQAGARLAQREQALAPLRDALAVDLVKRELITVDEASARVPTPGQALNNRLVLVSTYRLHNRSREKIVRATGTVSVRTQSDPNALLGVAGCFFDHKEPIPVGEVVEIRCANINKTAGSAEKDYVEMPMGALLFKWEPRSITLESGTELRSEN